MYNHWVSPEHSVQNVLLLLTKQLISTVASLGENCALAANQSVDCRAAILFTISLDSAKV